jgi:hypothetical protein
VEDDVSPSQITLSPPEVYIKDNSVTSSICAAALDMAAKRSNPNTFQARRDVPGFSAEPTAAPTAAPTITAQIATTMTTKFDGALTPRQMGGTYNQLTCTTLHYMNGFGP